MRSRFSASPSSSRPWPVRKDGPPFRRPIADHLLPGEKGRQHLDLTAFRYVPDSTDSLWPHFLWLTHCQGLDKDSHKDLYRSDSGVMAAVRVEIVAQYENGDDER